MKLFALLLLLAPLSAHATELYREVSLPGETMDQFMVRIAPEANRRTAELNAEVCGAIRNEGGAYHVSFSTDHRRDECTIPGDTVVYVHTHPRGQGFGFSPADFVRPGYLITELAVKYQQGRGAGRPRKVSSL